MDIQVSRAQGCAGATQLKKPYRAGTTYVIFESLDFIARLAALVPKPRVNLMRFARIIPDTRPLRGPAKAVQIYSRQFCHGVFAPNSDGRLLLLQNRHTCPPWQ
jgi:hypothetical protein